MFDPQQSLVCTAAVLMQHPAAQTGKGMPIAINNAISQPDRIALVPTRIGYDGRVLRFKAAT